MSAWPDSMVSSKHGSSPKVSNTHAEGSNASALRPTHPQGPSVRERKVSLQAAWSPSHAASLAADRKVSPSSTPVRQLVSALEARNLSPTKDPREGQEHQLAGGAEAPGSTTASDPSPLPEPRTGLLFAPTTSGLQPESSSPTAPVDKSNSPQSVPPITTEEPVSTQAASQPQDQQKMSAQENTTQSKTPDVRKPDATAENPEPKADTSVLSSQLSEPASKDPPLPIDQATTKPSSTASASPAQAAPAADKAAPAASTESTTTVTTATKTEAPSDTSAPAEETPALDQIEARLSALSATEQKRVADALSKAKSYPHHLPLTRPWCFYWSDTSAASNSKSKSSSVKSYTSGMVDLFETDNVPLLCGAMKAIKLRGRPQKGDLPPGGYGLHNTGQNLHVFRKGVAPVWEDPWSAKGGRFQITPPPGMVEPVFERLVLALVGGLVEQECGDGGAILGIVGSKRNRGDRCEIWVGGQTQETAPTDAWLESVRARVGQEIEVNVAKYKSHFG